MIEPGEEFFLLEAVKPNGKSYISGPMYGPIPKTPEEAHDYLRGVQKVFASCSFVVSPGTVVRVVKLKMLEVTEQIEVNPQPAQTAFPA